MPVDPVIDPEGFYYGLGSWWLENENEKQRMLSTDKGIRSQAGLGLMGALTQLLTSPTAGPLGLAAAARYGGPQSIASETGGEGIDMSGPQSRYDTLLDSMLKYANQVGSEASDIPVLDQGGAIPIPTPVATPTPEKPKKPPTTAGPSDKDLEKYGGRALIEKVKDYVKQGGKAENYLNQIKNVQALANLVDVGKVPAPLARPPRSLGLSGIPRQSILQMLEQYASMLPYMNLVNKDSGSPRPGFAEGGSMSIGGQPHFITDAAGNKVAALTEDGKSEQVSGVGGVEVTPLDPMRKALYESRKRMAKELAQAEESLKPPKIDPNKAPMMTPDQAVKTMNIMPREMARLQHGGFQMLPDQWTSMGGVGQVPIPTHGGTSQTRAEQIGPRPKINWGEDNDSYESMLAGLDPGSPDYKSHFATLLGTAFAEGNQAIDPATIRSLLRGKAPDKLISGSDFGTMDPSLQTDYASLLQAMGIIRSPSDLASQMNRYSPTALS